MGLFRHGDYTLRCGEQSNFKIECDDLTALDAQCLAEMIRAIVPKFCRVFGVPRGGQPFAYVLAQYQTHNAKDPILIVEDVFTTGGSMTKHRDELATAFGRPIEQFVGVAIFSRGQCPSWVQPLFQLHPNLCIQAKLTPLEDV